MDTKTLQEVIDECDAIREYHEGVGLSDTLVHCIELAYTYGQRNLSEPLLHMYEGDVMQLTLNKSDRIKLKVIERSEKR